MREDTNASSTYRVYFRSLKSAFRSWIVLLPVRQPAFFGLHCDASPLVSSLLSSGRSYQATMTTNTTTTCHESRQGLHCDGTFLQERAKAPHREIVQLPRRYSSLERGRYRHCLMVPDRLSDRAPCWTGKCEYSHQPIERPL